MLKKILKISLKILLTFLFFVLLYVSLAYGLSRITIDKERVTAKQDVEIYILTNGVHTDLVLPIQNKAYNWSHEVKFSNTVSQSSDYQYLAMGWGDKGFYLETPDWADLKASVAFKAAFAMSSTAIHATFYKTMPVDENCKKIMITQEQYLRLVDYIGQSFKKDKNGHFIQIITPLVYGKNDAFYEANGSYSLVQTCNTWANNGLKKCGQKSCLWTPFDTGIFINYK